MPLPFAQVPVQVLARVKAVATDIDDTMTDRGLLGAEVLRAVARLADAGLRVLLVTGRPAGLVAGLVTYLPGLGAGIAENGGAFVERDGAQALVDDPHGLQEKLRACEAEILARVGDARPTGDRYARMTDVTFHVHGLSAGGRAQLDAIAAAHGLTTIASSIHVHVLAHGVSKGNALERVTRAMGLDAAAGDVLTAGDSLTDGPIFDAARFPISVGVANVRPCLDRIAHTPAWITEGHEAQGFLEVADALLAAWGRR